MLIANDVAAANGTATHCAASERVVFSCRIAKSSKVLSLCASADLAPGKGALSYRFGRLGKPELVFPADPQDSASRFRYAHYFRALTDLSELTFVNNGTSYAVFDDYRGEEGHDEYTRGVRVLTGSNGEAELLCSGEVHSELGTLDGIVPCDADNALAMGCGSP